MITMHRHVLALAMTVGCLGCPADDPQTTDAGVPPIADAGADNGTDCQTVPSEDLGVCAVADDAYLPRQNGSAEDACDACITDEYPPISHTCGTIESLLRKRYSSAVTEL